MKPNKTKQRLPLHQIIFFSMGHVMNDLMLAVYSSYLLTFQTKVLGLPSNIVGLLWLIPAPIDAFLALLIGYVSDNITIPYFSKIYGKRKSWHLIGCFMVGLFTPFLLMRCFACGGQTDTSWQVVVYFVAFILISFSGWGLTQSNYLALIPEIANRRSEMVNLGAISSAVTLICGIYAYVVTWILLGGSGSESLSSKQTKEFMHLAIILAATGAFFIILFHIGTRENRNKQEAKKEKPSISEAENSDQANSCSTKKESYEDSKMKQGANQDDSNGATFLSCISVDAVSSVNENNNPSYEEDDDDHDTRFNSKSNSTMGNSSKDIDENIDNKTDALKNILLQTLPKENMEKAGDDIGGADNESFGSSSYEDCETSGFEDLSSQESTDTDSIELFMPETFMDMVPFHSNVILSSRRCSKVSDIGFFSGHHSRSSSKVYQRSASQRRRFSKDDAGNDDIPSRYCSRRSSRYDHGSSPSLPNRHSSRTASRVCHHYSPSERRRSRADEHIESFASENRDISRLNIGYSDSPSLPSRHASRSASRTFQKPSPAFDESKPHVSDMDENFPRGILSSRQNSRMSRGSPRTRHTRNPSKKCPTSSPLAMKGSITNEEPEYYVEEYSVRPLPPQSVRFSITSEYFYDTPGVEALEYPFKDNEKPWKKLVKNPVFYKLGGAYMFTRLAQNVTNSYMPLYLTDHLKFDNIAIAYFPLVILVSGVFASIGGKKLNKLLGNKWTFCVGSLLVMAASGWFYLLTEGTRLVMYIPAIMSGSGTSIMFVTTLALAAEFVDADRGSGAFLLASMSFILKIVSGTLFCLLQEYAPEPSSPDCPECTEYVRYVFSLTPGVSAFLGLVSFILFIPATIQCRPITQMEDAETQTDGEQVVGIPVINTLDIITEDEKEDDTTVTSSEVNEVQNVHEDSPNKKETTENIESEGFSTSL